MISPEMDKQESGFQSEEVEYGCCDLLLIGLSYLLLIALFPIAIFSAIKVKTNFKITYEIKI